MTTIFRTTAWHFADIDGQIERLPLDDEHRTKIVKLEIGCYSSLKKAEQAIQIYVQAYERDFSSASLAGFIVKEESIDQEQDAYGCVSEFESIRTYKANGSLNADSLYDERCKIPFVGRDEEVPFKQGDIVLFINSSYAYPAIVAFTPMTKEEWKNRFKPGVEGDFFDDSYTTIGMDGEHSHPGTPFIFQYVGKIDDDVQKTLNIKLDEYLNGVRYNG